MRGFSINSRYGKYSTLQKRRRPPEIGSDENPDSAISQFEFESNLSRRFGSGPHDGDVVLATPRERPDAISTARPCCAPASC